MSSIDSATTVTDLVFERPELARVFGRFGIDHCCEGKVGLEGACATKGLEPAAAVGVLEAIGPDDAGHEQDWSAAPLSDLCDHIVGAHHAYLREELPRLSALVVTVARAHAEAQPVLLDVADVFGSIAAELRGHMLVEEVVLFRACCDLEASGSSELESIAGPVYAMEADHDATDVALERLRALTDGFTPPPAACNSYRAMLNGLEALGRDLRRHIREESDILFPRAVALEAATRST